MDNPLRNLTAKDIQLIRAFAKANMRTSGAAEILGLNKTTVYRRLRYVYKKSKLNPCKFDELALLIQLIEERDYD